MFRIRDLSLVFPGNQVHAVQSLDMDLQPGCIHALLGENGAGKSTLARILCGHLPGWTGSLELDGQEYHPRNPGEALARGVALVPQHPRLAPSLDIGKNLFLGRGRDWWHDRFARDRMARILSARGLDLPMNLQARNADPSLVHWTAMAEALLQEPRWIILDEPSAAYPEEDVQKLYGLLSGLAQQGLGIVVITHRLKEVRDHADLCHILRAGRLECLLESPGAMEPASIARRMFPPSRNIPDLPGPSTPLESTGPGEKIPSLTGSQDCSALVLNDISLGSRHFLNARFEPGLVHGILGLWGHGLEELEDLLSGQSQPSRGRLDMGPTSPSRLPARERGYIPGQRFRRGIAASLSIRDNLMPRMPSLGAPLPFGPLPIPENRCLEDPMDSLSGGMIQKLIIHRELHLPPPSFLVCAEPWWGLDQRSQEDFTKTIRNFIGPGKLALILSPDIDEVTSMSDLVWILGPRGLEGPHESSSHSREFWEARLFHTGETP